MAVLICLAVFALCMALDHYYHPRTRSRRRPTRTRFWRSDRES